ncbi:methyl-CpG-binding domain-containing protein 9-like [Asparagus officinalis]|uniref:methyl-CpG-binding domain-containing protein 9-like n=1 Tax=Asparagus officinalis TaxID=4686 RepID=UPI00098E4462|nr:methyl-CpG-binding domain-containing protein 9-like [Asparagus officinalis]
MAALTPEERRGGVRAEAGSVRPFRRAGYVGGWTVWGGTVVRDGCESGFHLGCLRPRQRERALSGDWVCGECALSGPMQKRLVLGSEKLLDINEPLPGGDDCAIGRMSNHKEVSPNGGIDERYSCINMVQAGNGFELANNTGILTGTRQTCSVPNYGLNTGQGSEDLDFGSSVRGRPVLSSASRSGQFREELFLNALRNFVLEKGGFLGEGWHVEFIQSPYAYGPNPLPLYCAPDGKKFESMYDVTYYLGISSGISPVEVDERGPESGSLRRLLAPRRRGKDLARTSSTSRFTENHDTLKISHMNELCSDAEFIPPNYDIKCASTVAESYMLENGSEESQNLSIGLPLQYEDFFVLCLGKIDARAAYHTSHQIWPIGYRSNWHDKITGSLFLCEVSDDGDSGPVFKVRRRPCSLSAIPNGEIILVHNKARKEDGVERLESTSMIFGCSSNEEEDIVNLLSDPNPSEQEILSLFGHDTGEQSYGSSVQMNIEKKDSLTANLTSQPSSYVDPSRKSSCLRDVIGEFYVEGKSSSSVWKLVSRTFTDACLEAYKQYGCLQFCCTHSSFSSGCETLKDLQHLGSLARFCCASGPIETPRTIQSDVELESSLSSLTMWLEQDRFGLDMGFVQEIIENLPASRACAQYRFLIDRKDYSLSCTVGSGLLLATQKNGERAGGEVSSGLYNRQNGSKLQDLHEDPQLAGRQPPPGRPLSSKIPGELMGDVFQIWEFFWRFYEILGLKEPLSFEDLEEELIAPWPCDLNQLKRIDKENRDFREPGTDSADCSVSLAAGASDSTMHRDSSLHLMPVEAAATREATQVKVASCTFGSCSGVALTKAHISLLKVLVGELLNKVAAFLDPNFDSRDLKSKRGRKKDTRISYPPKEPKNDLSTINELTWPELAHRYILAVLSMNGRVEDVSARESLKIYRCLQGDGGVLCGSLSGVVGMEADALLLAEAERQLSCTTKQKSDVLPVDHKDSDAAGTLEPANITSSNLPEWAQPLEPVRKLPTNVGARIRNCVYSSLEKSPPEWAKEILEYSISKEVYKGNASGPTKRAVLSILTKLCGGSQQQKPAKAPKKKIPLFASDAIMKKCRIVLRSAVSADESKTFCNLLGTTLPNSSDNNERGILGSPAMVSRPLDFRTIDLRLAVGAYCGCHEAFLEDVREVWRNLHAAYGDQPDLTPQLERLSQNFEFLYKKEVLYLFEKIAHHCGTEQLYAEIQKELNDILLGGNELPKAPWEDGVCKVCGIDKDDVSVLLCDKCDSEYHRYCLNPPLARIPDGDWFCPSCVTDEDNVQYESLHIYPVTSFPRRNLGDETRAFQEGLHQLTNSMQVKEYWELNTEERILLLKFLCDEVLSSALIREHLEQCADKSNNAQQKLYALTIDWRNLKVKEELLAISLREHSGKSSGNRDFIGEEGTTAMDANRIGMAEQSQNFSNNGVIYNTKFSGTPLKRASALLKECPQENGQTDANQSFGQLLDCMIDKHANVNKSLTQQMLSDSMATERETHTINGHVLKKATINGNPFSVITVGNSNEMNGHENSVVPLQQRKGAAGDVVHGVDSGNAQRMLIGVAKDPSYSLDAKDILSREGNGRVQPSADDVHGSHPTLYNARTRLGDTRSMTLCFGIDMPVGELLPTQSNTLLQKSNLDAPSSHTDLEARSLELNSLRNEISHLQDSIASLERQVMFTSLRRDFLGRDSIGRLYWVIGKPGKRPWLVVGGGMTMPLVIHEFGTEIQQLVNWLRDADPREKELKEFILQWQRLALYRENIYARIDPKPKSSTVEKLMTTCRLITKALGILENKYGPCLELEASEIPKKRGRKGKGNIKVRMYRCECLEPVWPSRRHCLTCHQTLFSVRDFEGHKDGRCAPVILAYERKESDDQMKGNGTRSGNTKGKDHSDDLETLQKGKFDMYSKLVKFPNRVCPYDFAEISKKFITNDSNMELVKEIGLISSNGVPSLLPYPPMIFDPPLFLEQSKNIDFHLNEGVASSNNCLSTSLQIGVGNVSHSVTGNKTSYETKSNQSCSGNGKGQLLQTSLSHITTGKHASLKALHSNIARSCIIPELSLRPLLGKVSHVLRQLKINLLDMEAALPEEALRTSRSLISRRCAWRAFVKSAESIFEMIQAAILLEGMIKTDYLRNGWWYWSSLTAAARTCTVSALAFRIYTLDDSIIYMKYKDPEIPTSSDPSAENLRTMNRTAGKKRKVMTDLHLPSNVFMCNLNPE